MNSKIIEWKAPNHEISRNERHCNSNKATKTFFLMVFTFIILHSLRFVTSLGEFIVLLGKNKLSDEDLEYYGGPEWLYVVVLIGNICMVINASINFLIYLYLNSSKKSKVIHRCIPLINNTLMCTINTNLQRKACKEAPLHNADTNKIVSVAASDTPAANNLNLHNESLNDHKGLVIRKRSGRKTRNILAEWL